ncbi:hypothetical protein HZB00_00390 [Candidatus Woesearchaeota archaeon]|nr:hypothetical protein [Candidatus Woesearchaeota archaeon]
MKKGDKIDLLPFISSVRESFSLLLKNPHIFIPDILLILLTGAFAFLFLSMNNLLQPLLRGSFTLDLFQNQFQALLSYTPSFIKLILSFLFLLSLNVLVGISLVSTRYELIRAAVQHEPTTLLNAFRQGRKYFFSLFILKFVIGLLYALPLIFISWIFFQYPASGAFVITFTAILWALFRFMLFFAYPILYSTKRGIQSFRISIQTFFKHSKYTIICVLIFTSVHFLLAFIFAVLPLQWWKISLQNNLLQYTPLAWIIFLAVRIFAMNIWLIVWESSLSFATYKRLPR